MGASAQAGGKRRLAVLPFASAGGAGGEGGLAVAERLGAGLAGQPGVELVERTLIDKVLSEQAFAASGAVDPREARALGRVLGVDAVVTGTFVPVSAQRVEVYARVIDARTARVVGSAAAKVDKEWEESFMPARAFWDARPPDPDTLFAPLVRLIPDPFRDAPNDDPCAGWKEEAGKLQEETVELKARLWAVRVADPRFDARALLRNPGSELLSPDLRRRFYARLKELHAQGAVGLSPVERDSLRAADSRVDELRQRCE